MDNENKLHNTRHSLAHILAMAVLKKDPKAKLGIGPVIDNGFYYDFLLSKPLKDEDLKDIEKTMKKIVSQNLEFTAKEVSRSEAEKIFGDEPFKMELIKELSEADSKLSVYTSGEFSDLCKGPHVKSTKEINTDAFKLDKIAGAYWRGSEENQMLTRIYGLAFETKEELDAHLNMIAEAEKRDHRKLGKELKIFTLSPLVGSGLPLLQPNGMIIRNEIERYLWELHKTKGYKRVWTPHLAKEDLYVTSGHAAKFGDELFRVTGKEEKFFLKPMNCPHHMQIFADNQFSYRDMPVRYFEPATVYRDEKTGQLAGLTRVRSITQDDGHLFCRINQINQEVSTIVSIIKEFYTTIGMMNDYWVRLSIRGPEGKYLGGDDVWNTAEAALREAAELNKLPFRVGIGEAAFYGPKLDFMFKDAIGREWQLATIQCDFNLPERFSLEFTNEKGEKERPVVIHRAISGSLERFMGVMIEHYAGHFPTWLAPVQVSILPISEKYLRYAEVIRDALADADVRVELDYSNETLGKKIRESKKNKIPYMLIVGEKEAMSGMVTVESRKGSLGALKIEDFISEISKEIRERKA
ncbi:MAG TPA: threonine--tRNA ligase [Candidatus Paceibacterota bacterium]|nr:threonine--tRNA ligase [Candidatus Paceibacterota bacterium]